MSDAVEEDGLNNHIVIFGWSPRVTRVIAELRNNVHRTADDIRPILVVAETSVKAADPQFDRVYFLYGRTNDPQVLRRARLDRAHALIIPSSHVDMRPADGEGIFALLAALSVNPHIQVCLEVGAPESSAAIEEIRKQHLLGDRVEVVSFESVAERLLAQAAINRGVTRVYDNLLTFSEFSNEIYQCRLGTAWVGKTYRQLAEFAFDRRVTVIGFQRGEELDLNPENRDSVLFEADLIWFIALNKGLGLAVIRELPA